MLVEDLTWSTAPAGLDGFAKANLSMRSSSARSTAADTYLTVGKGARSSAMGDRGVGRVEPAAGGGLRLAEWDELVRHDAGLHYRGALGSLGQAVADAGGQLALVAADAQSPAAAAAADAAGQVRRFHPGGPEALADARAAGEDVVAAVEAGSLEETIDALRGTCVLVASASTAGGNGRLGVLAASPECGLGTGGLGSDATHDDHLATLPDVTRTFLALAGAGGEPGAVRATTPTTRQALVGAGARTRTADEARTRLVWLFVALHGAGAVVAVRRREARPVVACVLLAVPAASFLVMGVPWWRWGTWGAVAAGAVLSAALAAGALLLCRRDVRAGVGALAGLTALVVIVDALFGGPLEIDAPFGSSPVVAGRFFGVGNVGSGFLVAGLLVAGGLALDAWGRRALPAVMAAMAVGVGVLGAPWFGADAGGVVYGALACGVLVVGYLRGRLGPAWLAALAVGSVLLVVGFALVDMARSAGPATHLGQAVGGEGLGDLAVRKGARAVHSVTSPMALIVVVGAAALAAVRPRISDHPALRAAAWATLTAAVAGSVLNDSGVVVAAAVMAVAWPAAVASAAAAGPGGDRRSQSSSGARLATAGGQ